MYNAFLSSSDISSIYTHHSLLGQFSYRFTFPLRTQPAHIDRHNNFRYTKLVSFCPIQYIFKQQRASFRLVNSSTHSDVCFPFAHSHTHTMFFLYRMLAASRFGLASHSTYNLEISVSERRLIGHIFVSIKIGGFDYLS